VRLFRILPAHSIRDSGFAARESGCMAAILTFLLAIDCLANPGRPCMCENSVHRVCARHFEARRCDFA